MVVTASRIPQELDTAPVWVDIVNDVEIAESGARSVDEALRQVPGVTIRTNGTIGSNAGISMRGSTSEQVLVLVDGRRVNSPTSGSIDLNQIPLSMIDHIEVLQGSASALYGADAVGGVINIITKAGHSTEHQVYGELGEQGTAVFQGSAQGRTGSMGYFITGERIKSDGHRPNSDYVTTKLYARVDNQWSPSDFAQISLSHYNGNLGVPGSDAWPTPDARQLDSQTRADASYERTLSANANLNLRAYLDNGTMYYNSGFTESKHTTSVFGIETQMNQSIPGSRLTLSYGGNAESAAVNSTDLGAPRQRTSGAVFGHSLYELSSQTDASIGARYDWYSTHGAALTGRAGIAFRPLPTTRLYAFVGSSFRAPAFNELYWDDAWSKGNPNLLPETAWTYEAGMSSSIGGNANLGLSYFVRNARNLIGWQPQDPSDPYGIWEVANTAEAHLQGVEASWNQRLGSALTWQLGFTILDARDQNGAQLSLVAPQQGNMSITYQNQGFSATTQVATTTAAPSLPGYTVCNLSIEQALSQGMNLTLKVRNLLNARYAEQAGFPASPRSASAGIRFVF